MRKTEAGFSLNEMMVVAAITMLTVSIAAPSITTAIREYNLTQAVQTVAATVRNARYQAVTRNRTFRIRFNCPAANQMRVVEVTGVAAIDNAADRCSTAVYPYPAADLDPATLPNNDGPVVTLPQNMSFGAVQDMDISSLGRVTPLTACPACVVAGGAVALSVGDTHEDKRMTISGNGQMTISQTGYAR
jgi:type II secretory pathway pseudopilin PulG